MRVRNVALVLLGIAIALLCNWVYHSTEFLVEAGTGQVVDNAAGQSDIQRYVGGWPLEYYVRLDYGAGLQFTDFRLARLLINGMVWCALLAALFLYEWFAERGQVRSRRAEQAKSELAGCERVGLLEGVPASQVGSSRQRQLSLRDLLVLMLIFSLVFGYGRMLNSRRLAHEKFAQQLATKGGRAGLSAELPAVFAGWVPNALKQLLPRLTSVSLESPTNSELQQVLNLAGLREMSLSGGEYDLRLLDQIRDNPHLQHISVSERDIDAELVATLGAAKQLQSIGLAQTNVTSQWLHGLGEMPALTHLNLMRTKVELNSDDVPQWGKQVQVLTLPGPQMDRSTRVTLRGWPALKRLNCNTVDSKENLQPLTICLSELPVLASISISSRQLYDFELSHLPSLEKIERLDVRSKTTLPRNIASTSLPNTDVWLPTAAWVRNLSTEDVPALKELEIYFEHLEEVKIDVDDPLSIRMTTAKDVNMRTLSADYVQGKEYEIINGRAVEKKVEPDAPVHVRQQCLDRFGVSGGPLKLDLRSFSLHGVDLEPLARNRQIKSLLLPNQGVSTQHLKSLHEMKQLELLDLAGVICDDDSVEQLVSALPNLRFMKLLGSTPGSIKLENHPQLESVLEFPNQVGPQSGLAEANTSHLPRVDEPRMKFRKMEVLHVVNMPKLADSFQLTTDFSDVRVEQAPALRGLIFEGPMPAGTKLEGFRDLREFSGGGPRLTDAMASAVLDCLQLDYLTLAHTQLSNKTLAKISQLKQLRYLCLSGTPIDDKLVADWSELRQLKALHLDGTVLSADALKLICSWQDLEEVALDDVDASTLSALGALRNLRVLRVKGAELTKDNMLLLAKLPLLEILDLSECQMDEKTLDVFANCSLPQLRFLSLRAATVPSKPLLTLIRNNRQLAIDLRSVELDTALLDTLVGKDGNLIVDSVDRNAFGLGRINIPFPRAPSQSAFRSHSPVWVGAIPAGQYLNGGKQIK